MKQHRERVWVDVGRAFAVVVGTLALVLVGFPLFLSMGMVGAMVPAAEEQRTIDCRGSLGSTGEWRVPFVDASYRVTSRFGMRFHPIRHVWSLHNGTDLATAQTTVVAASSGVITAAGMDRTGFGNRVIIDHGSGITTLYGHLDRIDPTITVGVPVRIGQALGLEGSTGYSTAIHLHFTVTVNGTDVDPERFMRDHGAPLNGLPVAATAGTPPAGVEEGGVGFALPESGERQASLANPPTPIPDAVRALYVAAARRFGLPWTLLAGIGMEETNHGRNAATSSAGAQGLMQFMPATFAGHGIDGDNDGHATITNDADSIYSAANYLAASGATRGPDGITRALFAYNHATWYVGDVLFYAHAYGGGEILGGLSDCDPGTGEGDPGLPPLTPERVTTVLTWAASKRGLPYVMGANGPDAYDCSSFVKAAFSQIGITMPRTAQEQRDWLASGNGYRVPITRAAPGDLIFIDSYLGPDRIGHVAIVWNPAEERTIEAANPAKGIILGSYRDYGTHHIFEIWRIGNISDSAAVG